MYLKLGNYIELYTKRNKRISGRTKQLNFKVREEFYWQLKNRATEERCMMVEVLERSFETYDREKQKNQN